MNFPKWMNLSWLFPEPAPAPDPIRLRLMEIETERENLKAQIKEAEQRKKPRLHLRSQLARLTNEEDQLRRGK